MITVETYLNQPAEVEDVRTPAAYYLAIANVDPVAVAERGRAAGVALGEDPVVARGADEIVGPVVARDDARALPDRFRGPRR